MVTSTSRFIKENHIEESLSHEAITGGIDFKHYWKERTYFVSFSGMFSHITGHYGAIKSLYESSLRYYQRPDADYIDFDTTSNQLSGFGTTFEISKDAGGKWRYSEQINMESPGLELNDLGFSTIADQVEQVTSVAYVINEPKGIFRKYSIHASQSNNWNFGGDYLFSRGILSFSLSFKNKWSLSTEFLRHTSYIDTRLLRGGPAVKLKGFWHNKYSLNSDISKKIGFDFSYHFHLYDDKLSTVNEISQGTYFKPFNSLQISTQLQYSSNRDGFHYITPDYDENTEEPFVLASLDRKTLGLTARIDFTVTPEFTIQFYGNPYITVGKYFNYKHILKPLATDYNKLFLPLNEDIVIYDENIREYSIYINDITTPDYTIDNPDFNYIEFRSNLVIRWEYKPGSTVYFVWTQGRFRNKEISNYSVKENIGSIFSIFPENIFLFKFNYWFSI